MQACARSQITFPLPPLTSRAFASLFSWKEAGEQSKSAFLGSVTEMQGIGFGSIQQQQQRRAAACAEACSTSMSSAPVETLSMRARAVQPMRAVQRAAGHRACTYLCSFVFPRRARQVLPPDVILFLLLLGMLTGLLGITVNLSIDMLHDLRRHLLERTVTSVVDDPGCATGACVALHAVVWVGFSLALVWTSIFLTELIAPEAAGSGIPEMKSILSGGMKAQQCSYARLASSPPRLLASSPPLPPRILAS